MGIETIAFVAAQSKMLYLREDSHHSDGCALSVFKHPMKPVFNHPIDIQGNEDLRDSQDLEAQLEQLVPPDVLDHGELLVRLADLEPLVPRVHEVLAGSPAHEGHPASEQQVRSSVNFHWWRIILTCRQVDLQNVADWLDMTSLLMKKYLTITAPQWA